jgi:hypothetical protein
VSSAWPRTLLRPTAQGLLYYVLTSFVTVFGVLIGHGLLVPCPGYMRSPESIAPFRNWDGSWYLNIMMNGYSFDPTGPSSVAFFPAYPLLGRLVAWATGVRPEWALLLVSHLCLAGAFIVMAAYVRQRYPDGPPWLAGYVLLALGLCPTTFFFRLAYTESLFLLLAVLTLYGLERSWPLWLVASIIGLATATRLPGLCLLLPLVLHLWQHSGGPRRFAVRLVWLTPLACWGFAGFLIYQYLAFGEPFAFATAHSHWRFRPPVPLSEKLWALATLEPICRVFDESCLGCWKWHTHVYRTPLVSLVAANPVYFLSTCALIAWGACRRWLNSGEVLLAGALIAVSYGGRSHEMCMASMGRFMAVVFPVYLVLGKLFSRWPPPLVAAFLTASGAFVLLYAALFAAGYPLI